MADTSFWKAREEDVIIWEGYGAKVLRDACCTLVNQYPDVRDIYNRLKEDDTFARHFAQIPMDRLSMLHAPAKTEADIFINYYKLGLGDKCRSHINTTSATGSAYAAQFPVHDGKCEIPKSLLVLAATGTLKKMEAKHPVSFCRIMLDLYTKVCGKEKASNNDNIYSVCELSD
ncbi:hypothetical protein FA13DRAFT_1792485 [Coprinellus micaceus]|uniref:Uncharacterized protein n=1 Tax=Coprinellus micaceus TaxID=71717 RepID=A0A4Y7T941_COPMI|nr:hypothetical protein FA13DRAFT_1792485 [Coprinellus micaceus]